jgi:hypothetical protein
MTAPLTLDTRHSLASASDIFVFFCRGEGLLSRSIMRITDGQWSHCGIGFTIPAKSVPPDSPLRPPLSTSVDVYEVYFEALFRKGFQGPRAISHIYDWKAKDPRRDVIVVRLGVDPAVATEKLIMAQTLVGLVGYAAWQLVAMWAFERFGRSMGCHVPRSRRRVVCSEAVATILYPQIDVTDAHHTRLDEVTPVSLYWAIQRYLGMRHSADVENKAMAGINRVLGVLSGAARRAEGVA